MARSFDGVDDRIFLTSNLGLTAPPFTMAVWFYTNTNSGSRALLSACNNPGTNNRYYLGLNNATVVANNGATPSSSTSAITTTAYSTNRWNHACGVWSASNNRVAYLNGGGKHTDTTSIGTTAFNEFNIGAHRGTVPLTAFFNGLIAIPAIWNAALSDAEVSALAAGIRPDQVRPEKLISYHLFDPRILDVAGANLWTNVGTTDSSNHPPLR